MKNIKIGLIVALGAMVLGTGCKYEEGPVISFRSKKERAANTWVIDKAFNNGEDVTSEYDQYELQMLNDGDATLVANYSFGNFSAEFETNGTWDFKDGKENIVFDYENDEADNEYQILKLREEELWLREVGGEDELHLKPKE